MLWGRKKRVKVLPDARKPGPGRRALSVRVYGEDGSWLRDVLVRVKGEGEEVQEFDFRKLPGEVALEVADGKYELEAVPTESISHFYEPKRLKLTVTESMDIRVVLPLAKGVKHG